MIQPGVLVCSSFFLNIISFKCDLLEMISILDTIFQCFVLPFALSLNYWCSPNIALQISSLYTKVFRQILYLP